MSISRLCFGLALLLIATIAAAQPQVVLDTNQGSIVLELYPDKAPQSVENFLQYVREGHYDNTVFHRVIDNFMIQGGGYTADLQPKPSREPIPNEADNGLKNEPGTVAMARTPDPHSATAQFFINIADNDFLDFKAKTAQGWGYTVFGKVVEGMNVVDRIRQIPTGPQGPFRQDVPQETVTITGTRILNEPS